MMFQINRYDPKYKNPSRVSIGEYFFWSQSDVMKEFNNYAYKCKKYSESKMIEWITDRHFKCDGIEYKIENINLKIIFY